MPFRPRLRYLLWIFFAGLIFQIYIIQELVAMLLVFAGIFAGLTVLFFSAWIVQYAGTHALAWSETWLRGVRWAVARGAVALAVTRKLPRGTAS